MTTSGTTVSGVLKTNTVAEYTATNGVTVQGVNIKVPGAAPNTAQLTAGTSVLALDRSITTLSDDTTLGDPTPSANILPTQNAVYNCIMDAARLKMWVFTHDEPSGTGGGSLVANVWTQLVINTLKYVGGPYVTLASNQLTCEPGVYDFDCNCVRSGAQTFRLRAYDITNGVAIAYSTSSAQSVPVTAYSYEITMHIFLEFTAITVIQFEYWSSDAVATIGLGRPSSIPGITEQYFRVVITKDNWR
jgi:hypothetical protein